jgi:FG-GAP repeat
VSPKTAGALLSALICLCFALPLSAHARVKSNTQVRLPNNLYLGDVTGDGIADFLAVDGDRIFVTRTNFEAHGILYAKTGKNIKRMITGNFAGPGKEQVCAILDNGLFTAPSLACYGTSPANDALWWWFTMGTSIIADNEEAIVGDYNGDGQDDLLVYRPGDGAMRFYTRGSSGYFELMPNFYLGNLSNPADFVNMQLRAGEFSEGASPRRDDLLVYDTYWRQARRYESAVDSSGKNTFWWAFTTGWPLAGTDEDLSVANVNGDNTEDIVFRSRTTGAYRFFRANYGTGMLEAITTVSTGGLHNRANATAYWGKLKSIPSEAGATRDDALIYDADWQMWVRGDARFDGSRFTYWWVYTQYLLRLNDDQDGDGIKTLHELGGYDTDGNGVSDEPLHTYGASPFGRDLFVEVDYMVAGSGETQSHLMTTAARNLAVQEMAKFGINLHILVDEALAHDDNLDIPQDIFGGYDWGREFDPIKNVHFRRSRVPFFHYCVFGHRYNGGSSSGLSRGIGGSDFIVTLGGWANTTGEQGGTFLHELGHNLGLLHGGTDNENYKPNFLSVMNYQYQTGGYMKNGQVQFLYSSLTTNNLDENNLNEWVGVSASAGSDSYQTWYNGAWRTVNTSLDWSRDGAFASGMRVDINGGGIANLAGSPNEYSRLNFRGGSVGSAGAVIDYSDTSKPISELVAPLMKNEKMPDELDLEMFRTQVAPMHERMPKLDPRPLEFERPVYQPLFLDPQEALKELRPGARQP